jgi:hypothetical protein
LIAAALALRHPAKGAGAEAVIRGTVVRFWTHEPIAGCTVAVGRASTKTDAQGRFILAGVPPTYDLLVADSDGRSISVYRAVRRRDPIVEHDPAPRAESFAHTGAIVGRLSGGGPFPLTKTSGRVSVYFHASVADGVDLLPAPRTTSSDPIREGPDYGPLPLRWNGPSSIEGELIALRRPPEAPTQPPAGPPPAQAGPGTPAGWSFARRQVTVTTAEARTVNLELVPVQTFHVALKISESGGQPLRSWSLYYRRPIATTQLIGVAEKERGGRRDPLAYDVVLPDLRPLGVVLCASADARNGSSVERCGIGPNEAVSLVLAPPPAFSSPTSGAVLTPATTFAWTGLGAGIYELELAVWSPKASNPNIRIYTADRSAGWPDLGVFGLGFPALAATFPDKKTVYKCTLGMIGPYANVDDALGPDGLGAIAPTERRRIRGPEVALIAP